MRLLLLDSCDQDRKMIEMALQDASFDIEVFHAMSVEDANELLVKQEFDTVLMSDWLPGWDSMEMLLNIKNYTIDRQVTILVMSETDSDKHALMCVRSGAHDFLLKSEISARRLQRALVQATARSELELKLRQSYERVKFLAEHDSLTNLPNRYMFDISLSNSVEVATVESTCVGLLLLNIDRFKFINDTYGHDIGDMVLVEVANRITAAMGRNENLYRLGGDEFAIVIDNLAYAHVGGLPLRIEEALRSPFEFGDISMKVTTSQGVAFTPQNCDSAEMLLRCADIAMYRAKRAGGNNLCFVDDDAQKQFQRRFAVENELERALKNNEFVLHFQPVMGANSEEIVSCEALIRWEHPKHGLVYPDYFIEVAEESGMVVELGKWIIHTACLQMAQWQKKHSIDLVMALNISPQQLYDKSLSFFFESKLKEFGLKPQQFELEITETVLLKNTDEVVANLNKLVDKGFGLALDDFGTGYSSIQHLHSFPISTVKIDRSLMLKKDSPRKSHSLLRGLISMIDSMELAIVAEGIEDQENAEFCRAMGVERLQGYYYSRPVTPEKLEKQFLFPASLTQIAS